MHQNAGRLAALFLVLLLTAAVGADGQVAFKGRFSDRVGNGIDSVERGYFGLFPAITAFRFARLDSMPGGGMWVRIVHTDAAPDSVLSLSPAATALLREYIDRFEELSSRPEPRDWSAIAGLFESRTAVRPTRRATVTTRSGEEVSGTIVAITDTSVILWRGTGGYDWRHADDSIAVIDRSRVERMVVSRPTLHWAIAGAVLGAFGGYLELDDVPAHDRRAVATAVGAVPVAALLHEALSYDAYVGGDPDRLTAVARDWSEERAFEPDMPPELVRLLDARAVDAGYRDRRPPRPIEDVRAEAPLRRFHLRAGRTISHLLARNDVVILDFRGTGSGFRGAVARVPLTWASFAADYAIDRRWRIGAEFNFVEPVDSTDTFVEERISGPMFAVTGSYALVPTDPLLDSRFAVTISAGPRFADLSWSASRFVTPPAGRMRMYTGSALVLGAGLGLRADIHASPFYSMFVELSGAWFPPIRTGEPSTVVFEQDRVVEHTVDVSNVMLTFGSHFHL